MQKGALLAFLLAALIGCGHGVEHTLQQQGTPVASRERKVTFRFTTSAEVAARAEEFLPEEATHVRFVGRTSEQKVVFDSTLAKKDEFSLKASKAVDSVEVQAKMNGLVLASKVFPIPPGQDVRFQRPVLERMAISGGDRLTLEPINPLLSLGGELRLEAFLGGVGPTLLKVTRATEFISSDEQLLSINSEGMAQGHGSGEVAVQARFRLARTELAVVPESGIAEVRLLDATSHGPGLLRSFFAFGAEYDGGASIATADVTGDGIADFIVGSRDEGARVRVFDGERGELLHDLRPFGKDFSGGVKVAAGDLNGNGKAEVIVGAGHGGPAVVKVLDGATGGLLQEIEVFEASFIGGVHLAVGDFTGDGLGDIVVGAGTGGPSRVRIFHGSTGSLITEFLGFEEEFVAGVRVAAGDVNGDGADDIILSTGPGFLSEVRVFNGQTRAFLGRFIAYEPDFVGGVYVASGDLDGDGVDEIVTSPGAGSSSTIRVFRGVEGDMLTEKAAFDASLGSGAVISVFPKISERKTLEAGVSISVVGTSGTPGQP